MSNDSARTADAEEPPFGAQAPTRFAADVEYRGTSHGHDYVVRVRHRLLDTSATVVIDGVEHDPKAEQKAWKNAEKDPDAETPGEGDDAGEKPPSTDDLQFRCEDGFSTLRFIVRRPDSDGDHEDAEVIHVRTVGLGGAGEVDVRRGFGKDLLVPEEGSPSAARETKRAEHPTRFALIEALAASARYLIPLLGLGALFSGLLDPLKEGVERMVRPVAEAVAAFLAPIRDWFSDLTRPVREFFSALLRPVGDALSWLVELLFGWIPDLSLPFSIPGWVVDVAIPLIVMVSVFLVTFRQLRQRRARLEKTRKASRTATGASGSAEGAKETADDESVDAADAADAADGDTDADADADSDSDSDSKDSSSTAPPRPQR